MLDRKNHFTEYQHQVLFYLFALDMAKSDFFVMKVTLESPMCVFIIAPKHNKLVMKIFIIIICTLRAMKYLKICPFCALCWIILKNLANFDIILSKSVKIIAKNLEF